MKFQINKKYKLVDVEGFLGDGISSMANEANKRVYDKVLCNLYSFTVESIGSENNVLSIKEVHNAQELSQCRWLINDRESKYFVEVGKEDDKSEVVLSYVNNKNYVQKGIVSVKMTDKYITIEFDQNRVGFVSYTGVSTADFSDLKSIGIKHNGCNVVFTIENGIVVKEHHMYNDELTFKKFTL